MDEQQQPGGLLNFFQSPGGQGLLSAIAGYAAGARRGTPVNNIGKGLLAGVAGYQGANEDLRKQQEEQRKLAQQQKLQTLLANPKASFGELAAAGAAPDMLRAFNEYQQGPKIHSVVQSVGPDGQPLHIPIDAYGRKVGDGYAGYVKPEKPQKPTYMNTSQGIIAIGEDGVPKPIASPSGEGVLMPYSASAAASNTPGAPGVAPKPMTDTQSNALLFGNRAKEAHALIKNLSKNGINKPFLGIGSTGGGVVGGLINMSQPPEFRQMDQAKLDFMTAVLRKESGAAISQSEFETAERQYFPRVGDDPATIAQKAKNRELAIQGILAGVPEAHRGDLQPQQPQQQQPAIRQSSGQQAHPMIQQAKQAIAAGRDPEAVMQMLKQKGIDPSGLIGDSMQGAFGGVSQ